MEYSTSTIPATKTASCSVWHVVLMYFSFFQCSSVHVKYTLGMCWLVGTVVTCTVVSLHHRGQSAHSHSDQGIKAHSSYLHKELPWAQVTDFTAGNPAGSIAVLLSHSHQCIIILLHPPFSELTYTSVHVGYSDTTGHLLLCYNCSANMSFNVF